MVPPSSAASASCVCVRGGLKEGTDGWMQRKEGDGIVDLMDRLLTYPPYPSPSFPLSVSASHLLPHALTLSEESILLTSIISLLSISVPLPATSFWPVLCQSNTLAVGTNERVSLPVPQQSYHVLIRSIPVYRLILLHPLFPV